MILCCIRNEKQTKTKNIKKNGTKKMSMIKKIFLGQNTRKQVEQKREIERENLRKRKREFVTILGNEY